MKISQIGRPLIIIIMVSVVVFVPFFLPSRWQHIFIMGCLWSIVGMGWLVIFRVGELSLGSAGFLCIGAYSSSVITLKLGGSFWLALIAAGLLSSIVALALGVLVFRLTGLYFLIITYVFAEMLRLWISLSPYLGRAYGLLGIPVPGDIGFISFSTKQGWIYLSFFLLLITAVTFWRVERSRIGRVYSYISIAPDLAQSIGLRIMKYKVQAFVLGAFFTGLAGAVMAHYFTGISPESFTVFTSLVAQLVAILGGVSYLVLGPVLGSFLYAVVDEYVVAIAGLRPLIVGSLLIVMITLMPMGMLGKLGPFFRKASEVKLLWHS